MKPAPIVLKDFFASTFNYLVNVVSIETISTGVYKLTYSCGAYPFVFVTGENYTFQVVHNGTTHFYKVTEIGDCDFTIEVSGTDYTPVIDDTFLQGALTFIHGTQKKAKPELDALLKNVSYPLVYLQEIQNERFTNDPNELTYSNADIRLWLLLPSNVAWFTDQHYDKVIDSMKNLAHEIMRQLYYNNVITERNEYNVIYHANVGTSSDTGHLKDLLNQHYSGVLLNTTLSLSQLCVCC